MKQFVSLPFFSVVMPVYNGQAYISAAIESVLAQTDRDWELVIVDDFSHDKTPDILAAYASRDKRIRVLTNDQNIKAARSLNRGIQAAKGEWIAHIDADDLFIPGYLKTLRIYVEKLASPDWFLSSWIAVVDESGTKLLDVRLPKADTIRHMMKFENFLYHSATSFSKRLWEKVGGYPEQDSAITEDVAMWNRFFAAHAKLVMIPELLVHYRLHYTNITSIKDTKLSLEPTGAKNWKMIRQNQEWRASLYLKQKMLAAARTEILKIGRIQKSLSLKNIQYFLLTFLPKSFVVFYMWEMRPRMRSFFRNMRGGVPLPRNAAGTSSL